jgi:hypothetical protein
MDVNSPCKSSDHNGLMAPGQSPNSLFHPQERGQIAALIHDPSVFTSKKREDSILMLQFLKEFSLHIKLFLIGSIRRVRKERAHWIIWHRAMEIMGRPSPHRFFLLSG